MSKYEHANRMLKVARLVAEIDRTVSDTSGVASWTLDETIAVVSALDNEGWTALAQAARVNVPSRATRELVLSWLKIRAERLAS